MLEKARRTFVSEINHKLKKMKANTISTDSTSQTFLTGAILFANVDYSGFAGYAVKAAIGGLIWMVFKLAGDYLSHKLLEKKKNTKEQELPNSQDNDKEN